MIQKIKNPQFKIKWLDWNLRKFHWQKGYCAYSRNPNQKLKQSKKYNSKSRRASIVNNVFQEEYKIQF